MTLGEKIDVYLARRQWKLADLARMARIDVKTLAAMRARKTRATRFAPEIAHALGITLEELLEEAPPRPMTVSEPPAHYSASDPLETQLLQLYRGCTPHRREDLLRQANLWYVEANPRPSVANPFPVIRAMPASKLQKPRKPHR